MYIYAVIYDLFACK